MAKVAAGSNASTPKMPTRLNRIKGKGKGSLSQGLGSGKNSGVRRYGAYGGYEGVSYKRASNLAQSMIRPELRALRSDRRQIRRETRAEIERANTLYGRSVGDINHIYDESSDYIGDRQAAIGAGYDTARADSAAAQAALASQLNATAIGTQSQVNAELSRLGIGLGGADRGAIAGDAAFASGTAAISGANNLANLNMADANASAIGQLLQGMQAGGRSSNLGKVLNNRNDSIFEAEQARNEGFAQVRDAMRDVRGGRKDIMLQLLEQLSQTGWQQYMDQQGLNLQRRAMRQSGGGGGYGSSGSSGGSSTGSGYYGAKVDAMIDALSGGATVPGPKPKEPPKGTKKPPPLNLGGGGYGTTLSGI
jgi:hypothetical protein